VAKLNDLNDSINIDAAIPSHHDLTAREVPKGVSTPQPRKQGASRFRVRSEPDELWMPGPFTRWHLNEQ
jgi:hypothetical protein